MKPIGDSYKPFDEPAIYSITVQGAIGEDWSDRLGGMAITSVARGSRGPITTLVGELRDQASLSGVLDTLYSLHLPVIAVQRLCAR